MMAKNKSTKLICKTLIKAIILVNELAFMLLLKNVPWVKTKSYQLDSKESSITFISPL